MHDLLGWRSPPESSALLRKQKQEHGRSATAVPPTDNPISPEHGSAPIAKAFALASGGKHCLAGLHSLWVNTHSLPETQPVLRSQQVDHPWKAKGLPTPWFHTQQDIGKITLFFPPDNTQGGFATCSRYLSKPQDDGGLTGSTTLEMLAAFPSRTQLDHQPQDLVYFIAAHRNAVGGHKGIQSSY